MNTVLVILGGILAAGMSAGVAYLIVPTLVARELPGVLAALAEHTDTHHLEDPVVKPRRPATSTIIIIALVAVIAVLSVQVTLSMSAEKRARADTANVVSCLQQYAEQTDTWANGSGDIPGVTDSLQATRDANQTLRERTQVWTTSVDGIFQLLFDLRANPDIPAATIDAVIADYQRAITQLSAAYVNAEATAVENPYPELVLTCSGKKKPKEDDQP